MGDDLKYAAPASKNGFEIAILCALPKERAAVLLLLDDLWDGKGSNRHRYARAEGDFNTYTHGRIGRFNVVIVLLDTMGKVPAAGAATAVRIGYPNISLALIVGICAGVPFPKKSQEITLGDIVISNILIHCDFGRQYSDRFKAKVQVEDVYGRPHKNIRSLLRSLGDDSRPEVEEQAAEYLRQLQEKNDTDPKRETGKYKYPGVDKDKLFEDDYEHKHHEHHDPTLDCGGCTQGSVCEGSREIGCDELRCDNNKLVLRQRLTQHRAQGSSPLPQIHIGRMGSGDSVIRSAQHRNALAAQGVIGIEMEGAGVWDQLPCIVVKGVCDYADSHKGKGWQDYAAATAASVAKAVLDEYPGSGRVVENAGDRQGAISIGGPIQPRFSNLPFPPDNGFIERGDIAEWLREKLDKPGSRAALYGLGGVGKSRLVIQYARTIEQTPSKPHIFWVHAGTRERFTDAYREIADGLKLEGRDKPEVDILKLVCNGLRHESKEWLMIVDNADDINIFFAAETHGQFTGHEAASSTGRKSLLPYLPRMGNGRILVTTRSQEVAELLVTQVTEDLESIRQVTAMEKDQAKQLLRKRLGKYHDDKIEQDLVNVLDCIPLAIIQAAAFIVFRARNNVYSAAEYLEQFTGSDDHNLELLDYGNIIKLGDVEASHAVLRTWKLTYEQIKQERSSAADLLSILSFLHNQGIPEWVLKKYYDLYPRFHSDRSLPQDSPNPLNKDLDVLCGYSLVAVESFPGNQNRQQPTSRSLQMHALVQTCTRHWLRSNNVDQQWLSTVTQLLERSHPWPDHETWAKCAEISPHVDSLLTFPGLEQLDEPQIANLVHLLANAGEYNTGARALTRAESLVLEALDVAEKRLCNPHRETYWVLSRLETLSSRSHNPALKTRLESSANRYCAGLITVGVRLAEHATPTLLQESGYRGKTTNSSYPRLNLLTTPSEEFGALSAYMQTSPSATVPITSDPDEHTEQHKRVILSIQDMKSAGFDNPTVLEMGHLVRFILNAPFCHSTGGVHVFTVIRDITRFLWLLKRYEDIEVIYRALLKRQTCFTEQDWDIWYFTYWFDVRSTAKTQDGLCEVLIKQCKYQEAEDLVRMTLESNQGIGDFHITLGKLLFEQKRFEEAEKVFRKALDLHYTPDDDFEKDLTPQTFTKEGLWYNEWLGKTLAKQGKHDEAVVCFRQILEWSQQLQLLEHPDTLPTYRNLAKSLECLGEYKEAEGLRKHCVEVCESKFSDDHCTLRRYLAGVLKNLKSQGKRGKDEFQRFEDRLSELGYELIPSDDDGSREESDSGSEISPDGSQAGSEGGHSPEHRSEELQVESTSTAVDPTTMTTRITIRDLAHDYDTMNLTSQDHERHDQWIAGEFDKPLLNHDDSTPTERDRQLEESGVEIPGVEAQVQGHEGALLTSTTPTIEEQYMEMPTQWIQTDQAQGTQIMDEPEDMEMQVTSETLESDATKRKIAHSMRPNIGRSASEDSDSSDDVSTASTVIEQLEGRLEGRENTSRHGMRKFFALGLGKRRSLRAERALEDWMRLLKEVEKKAGEESDKDQNEERGDDDEVDEEVE